MTASAMCVTVYYCVPLYVTVCHCVMFIPTYVLKLASVCVCQDACVAKIV